jgi:ABC-type uncharacterized transport system permease subunit
MAFVTLVVGFVAGVFLSPKVKPLFDKLLAKFKKDKK